MAEPTGGWARRIGVSGGGASGDSRQAIRFLREVVTLRRGWVGALLALSLLAAIFEGTTMGVLALALQVVTSSGVPELAAEFGRIGAWVDRLAAGWTEQRLFVGLVLFAVASQLLRSAATLGSQFVTAHLVSRVEADARQRVFRQIVSISYSAVRRRKAGDLASFTNEVTHLGAAIVELSAQVMQVALMAAYSLVLLWISWKLSLAALAAGAVILFLMRGLTRRVFVRAEAFKTALVDLNATVVEYLHGLAVVRAHAREEAATMDVGERIHSVARSRRAMIAWQATLAPTIDVITVLGLAGLLLAGYFLLGDARLALAAKMATFLFVLYRLIPRISILNKNWGRIVGRLPFIERIAAWVRTDDKEYPSDGKHVFTGLAEGIRIEGVTFRYDDADRFAVEGLEFELPAGGMVALVGESGSGKSTLARLLLRFHRPDEGRILVDNRDLGELEWNSWRQHLGVVSQDTFLFHASVRDNIAFGVGQATDEAIETAARAAHADEFIRELPEGYDTVLGEQGERLSGGQRQRISIARALLKDPAILILDEATSDLDSRAERDIQQAIEALRGERTILVIAHRLSTVQAADEIVVLERGRIAERGVHRELLGLGGRYAMLWRLQAGREGQSEESRGASR